MNVQSDFETLIKLAIIGDSNIGKSNFLFQFIEGQFSPLHVATIGFDYKSKIITLPSSNRVVKLQIWDTAGQEKYMSINKNLFQRVQGIILMYDITKRESFERLEVWINLIKQNTNDLPMILVGNKLDQEDNDDNGRIVETSEGENFAKKRGMEFFEASALEGKNVEKAFICIAEKVIQALKDDRSPSAMTINNVAKKKKKKCC